MTDRALSLENPLNEKLSHTQFKLMAFLLLVATKVCTLPTYLTGISGAKAAWVVCIACVFDVIVLGFALQVARRGGIIKLALPQYAKSVAGVLLAAFLILKLTAFAREISTYFAVSLFESVPVVAIAAVLLAACSMGARKGFSGIARVEEIFIWVLVFVLLFVVIFTRTSGEVFNALALFNPDTAGFGTGLFRCLGWFGDVCIVAFFDLSNEGSDNPQRSASEKAIVEIDKRQSKEGAKYIAAPAFCAIAMLFLFYTVFISVYGEAAGFTPYAFIKLSAFKANTDELGSADWPVIILWAIFACFYLAIVLEGIKESCRAVKPFDENKKGIRYAVFAVASVVAIVLGMLVADDEADFENFVKGTLSVATPIAYAVTVALGFVALRQKEGESNE